MPNYTYIIAKAVDLVARKLAGMDPESASRVTQALSDEARVISDELQRSGQPVDQEILAARLDGLVTRMKYEMRNQQPDPSPHEFPIFNVSHNPTAPYPNPINHLYDKRYREAYSTFIKQNQPPPGNNVQDDSGRQSSSTGSASRPNVANNYPQNNAQAQKPPNPYADMPPGQQMYYQQRGSQNMPPIPEKTGGERSQRLQRSATDDNLQADSISRSSSNNDLDFSSDINSEKIRVRVVKNNPTGSSSLDYNDYNHQRNVGYRPNIAANRHVPNASQNGPVRRVYAPPGTEVGDETMQQLFQVANRKRSESGRGNESGAERVIIIDRRGSNSNGNGQHGPPQDRYRTFEIRAENPTSTPTTPTSPPLLPSTNSAVNLNHPGQYGNYFMRPSIGYQQPRMYHNSPNMMYGSVPSFMPAMNGFYPFAYYQP